MAQSSGALMLAFSESPGPDMTKGRFPNRHFPNGTQHFGTICLGSWVGSGVPCQKAPHLLEPSQVAPRFLLALATMVRGLTTATLRGAAIEIPAEFSKMNRGLFGLGWHCFALGAQPLPKHWQPRGHS